MIRPVAGIAAASDQMRQLPTGLLAQSDQVDGLAPCGAFFGTPSRRHLTDHARQHIGRMLPADDVKTLETLVDEIERVPAIGVGAVRLGGQEEICECSRRGAAGNGRLHSSLGRIPMPHGNPAP